MRFSGNRPPFVGLYGFYYVFETGDRGTATGFSFQRPSLTIRWHAVRVCERLYQDLDRPFEPAGSHEIITSLTHGSRKRNY